MRFAFVNQFYPPDVAPTGRLLHDVARLLTHRGHDVRVLCGRIAYGTGEDLGPGGTLDGVLIERVGATRRPPGSLLARAARDLAFLAAAARALGRGPRPDVVVAATSPPLLGFAAALRTRRTGVALVQWTMDLYPHVLAAHWRLRDDGWGRPLIDAAGRLVFGEAALVLTLGPYMARRVAGYVHPERLRMVPTWSDVAGGDDFAAARSFRRLRGWADDDLVLMYSGNMGRGHRFGEFMEAARRLGPRGPVWAFAGGGPRRPEVERFRGSHPEARIELLPYVTASDLRASLRSADVQLVSLFAAWQGLIVPSKLQASFAVGLPVVFVGPPENEVAAAIRDSGGGWIVAEGDIEGLVAVLAEARDPKERARRGRKALEHARAHFDRERNSGEIADLLERCPPARAVSRGTFRRPDVR